MEGREKPRPSPDYLMQLMNDKKLMGSLPNFCGIFTHLERLLDEGETPGLSLSLSLSVCRTDGLDRRTSEERDTLESHCGSKEHEEHVLQTSEQKFIQSISKQVETVKTAEQRKTFYY